MGRGTLARRRRRMRLPHFLYSGRAYSHVPKWRGPIVLTSSHHARAGIRTGSQESGSKDSILWNRFPGWHPVLRSHHDHIVPVIRPHGSSSRHAVPATHRVAERLVEEEFENASADP